jgi:hypothetical protein
MAVTERDKAIRDYNKIRDEALTELEAIKDQVTKLNSKLVALSEKPRKRRCSDTHSTRPSKIPRQATSKNPVSKNPAEQSGNLFIGSPALDWNLPLLCQTFDPSHNVVANLLSTSESERRDLVTLQQLGKEGLYLQCNRWGEWVVSPQMEIGEINQI